LDSVYIYIRWSSKKQEQGDSRERQTQACVSYAERQGWPIAEVPFGDFGVSAWKGDHLKSGSLGRFSDRVRSGEIPKGSILLVEALDRLSRQEWRLSRNWLEEMTDAGLRIATVQGSRIFDYDTMRSAAGIMSAMEIMMAGHASNQLSETISVRLKSSWVRRRREASEGRIISRHVPGWLTVVGEGEARKFEPIGERVEAVREIYTMAADGVGSRSIARTLNQRGIRPWGRAHHHANSTVAGWEHTYVSDILASAAVEGDYEPKIGRHHDAQKTGERFVGYFGEAIVDADLVARARAGVRSRRRTGGRGRDQCRNLFAGLVRCAECKSKMTLVGNSAKPARYLQCMDAGRGRGCQQKKTFPYKAFEGAALDALLPLALDDRHFSRPDDSHSVAVELAETNKAIFQKEADENRLVELLLRNELIEAIEKRLRQTQAERRDLEQKRCRLDAALAAARGAVSPQEHLRRVIEVRGALDDLDHETRLSARRKVSEAIKGMGVEVTCGFDRAGNDRRFMLRLPVAGLVYFFGADGARLSGLAPDRAIGDPSMLSSDDQKRQSDYLRRRQENGQLSRPFEGWTDNPVPEIDVTIDDVLRQHGLEQIEAQGSH